MYCVYVTWYQKCYIFLKKWSFSEEILTDVTWVELKKYARMQKG